MHRLLASLALAGAAAFAAPAAGAELPLWEAGAGVTALRLPDYRGSDQSRGYLLPFPYLVYRGEVLRVTREGVRARLFDARRVELDLSASGSVPVDSDRNRARAGMPDLRPTLEVGPRLRLTLYTDPAQRIDLELRLPLRAALTYGGDTGVRDLGWAATPDLSLNLKPRVLGAGANLGLTLGALIGDRRLNGYFYDVPARHAADWRPAYRARGGYAGWQATATLSRRAGRLWAGGFVRYDDLSGAVFADSPLVTRRHNLGVGVAVAWVFAESAARVARD